MTPNLRSAVCVQADRGRPSGCTPRKARPVVVTPEPARYEDADDGSSSSRLTDDSDTSLAAAGVLRSASANAGRSVREDAFRAFDSPHCTLAPPVEAYLDRFFRITGYGSDVLVVALVYVARSGAAVRWLNVHRLLLAALVLAAKWRSDRDGYHGNDFYARIGGVPVAEMNSLERSLLTALDWRLSVSKEDYDEQLQLLQADGGAGWAGARGYYFPWLGGDGAPDCIQHTFKLLRQLAGF